MFLKESSSGGRRLRRLGYTVAVVQNKWKMNHQHHHHQHHQHHHRHHSHRHSSSSSLGFLLADYLRLLACQATTLDSSAFVDLDIVWVRPLLSYGDLYHLSSASGCYSCRTSLRDLGCCIHVDLVRPVQISCFPLLWLSVDFFSVHSLLYIPILPITDNTRVRVLLDGSPSSPPPLSSSSSPSSASPSSPRPFTLNEISALHHGGLLQLVFFYLLCECQCYWPFLCHAILRRRCCSNGSHPHCLSWGCYITYPD